MENKYNFVDRAEEERVAREIVDTMFSWGDLDSRYANASPSLGNVICVFHGEGRQRSLPAKFYWDDEREIMVLHCFREHKTFTCYDYVKLILVENKKYYSSVWSFLEKELSEKKVRELISVVKKNKKLEEDDITDQKREYIENLYNKYDSTVDFINSLYLELEV